MEIKIEGNKELNGNENNITKKNREKKSKDIKKLWYLFDTVIDNDSNSEIKKTNLECVYRTNETKTIIENEICTSCKTHLFVGDDGFLTCPNKQCGIIYKDNLDQSAEWRFYGADDNQNSDPTRCGMAQNLLLPDSSIGTCIKNGSNKSGMYQVKQYQRWTSMTYKERSMYKVYNELSRICKENNIPEIIITESKSLYKLVCETKISRGNNRKGIIAACVYFACRDENVPRSTKEIAGYFDIKLQDMTRGIKKFRENWRLANPNNKDDIFKSESSNPIDFIERYCSNLPIETNIKHISEFIAIKAIFSNLVDDNTSPSIAAGSIFLACSVTKQNITKKQVAEACKTSEVTISKCFKKLNNRKLDLLPRQIRLDYNIK